MSRRAGATDDARRLLSLLPIGDVVTWEATRRLMAINLEIVVGSPVVVTVHGRRSFGKVEAEPDNSAHRVRVGPPSPTWKPPRGVKQPLSEVIEADTSKVVHSDEVVCTEWDLWHARQHQQLHFPGADVKRLTPKIYVERLCERTQSVIVSIFTSRLYMALADGGIVNARKGIRFHLKTSWRNMHAVVNKELKAQGLRKIDRRTLHRVVGSAFAVMHGDSCCCPSCKELGWDSYAALRSLVEELYARLAALGVTHTTIVWKAEKEKLLLRIDLEENFRRTSSHVTYESPCTRHCLACQLTTVNNPAFRDKCTHNGQAEDLGSCDDHGMEHDSICSWCGKDCRHGGLKCLHCPLRAHVKCAQNWGDGASSSSGTSAVPWVCPNCSAEGQLAQHPER